MGHLQQKVGRATGLVLFTGMIGFQLWNFPWNSENWLSYVRWGLITFLFALFLSAYVVRKPAVGEAKGLKETVLPLFCAGLPFAIIMLPNPIYNAVSTMEWDQLRDHLWKLFRSHWGQEKSLWGEGYGFGLFIMAVGELITVGGMLTLRSSFSIFSEARKRVSTGLYGWIRHPLYTGEILSLIGYAIYWPSYWSISLTIIFTFTQAWRAKVEESKLIESFPEYAEYRKKVGFLLPHPSRFLKNTVES